MKLLLRFFSNSATKAYLRGLSQELGENTNAVRLELNRLSAAGLLQHEQQGNTVLYHANTHHPFFNELQRLVMKYMGLDNIVDLIAQKLGKIELAFVTGDYARGVDSGVIELVLVGDIADEAYLDKLHQRAEQISGRQIRIQKLKLNEYLILAKSLDVEQAIIILATANSGVKAGEGYWVKVP